MMPAYAASPRLLAAGGEASTEPWGDHTHCKLHSNCTYNRGGGVVRQRVLKVGSLTLQLPVYRILPADSEQVLCV